MKDTATLASVKDYDLTKIQQRVMQAHIKKNYLQMYTLWSTMSDNGFDIGR